MGKVVIFKGRQGVMNLQGFDDKSRNFYHFLDNYFTSLGHQVEFIDDDPKKAFRSLVPSAAIYFIGHSSGANRIIQEFNPLYHQHLKGIICFDPNSALSSRWNSLKIKKLLITSTRTQDFTTFEKAVKINDDFFFNNSLKDIEKHLDDFNRKLIMF